MPKPLRRYLRPLSKHALSIFLVAAVGCATALADPVSELKSFSDFKQVELDRLMKGEVLTERGSLMDFPNGITVQTCFAVPYPPEKVARCLQQWDPSRHQELKVFGFGRLSAPVVMKDFDSLDISGKPYPVRWLREKISATTESHSDLNLNRAEAKELSDCVQKSDAPATVKQCFSKLLLARATAFQRSGFFGGAAYELGSETVLPGRQLQAMLGEQTRIEKEFDAILKQSGILTGKDAKLTPVYYYSFFDANHKASLSLGAMFMMPTGERIQLVDTEYYVCANYYTSTVLYEIWPIRAAGKEGSLVWRGDFFAAPTLAITKGTERVAYGALMLQSVKQFVRHFSEDLKASR
jgi:hypothetical protein